MKGRAMRFLANENVTGTVIQGLRQRGHDVLSVKESMRSERDDVILARAQAELRIVVTHDKDFGELAFRSQLPASCGVILFRLAGSDPDTDNQRILEALESRTDWTGHFSVITDNRIRMRALPVVPPPGSARPRKRKGSQP
jgi:predicted nuclease of predicted toxin-antitoxin system